MGHKCEICDSTDTRYCRPVFGYLCSECASAICSDEITLNYNITADDFTGEHWDKKELNEAYKIATDRMTDYDIDRSEKERWEAMANAIAENYHLLGGSMSFVGRYVDKTSEALFWSMFYNGREYKVKRLYWDMKAFIDKPNKDEYESFKRPDYLCGDNTDDLEVFWMVLVQRFGEYGTSPRSGWFGKYENPEGAVEWLRQNIESTFDSDLTLVGNIGK